MPNRPPVDDLMKSSWKTLPAYRVEQCAMRSFNVAIRIGFQKCLIDSSVCRVRFNHCSMLSLSSAGYPRKNSISPRAIPSLSFQPSIDMARKLGAKWNGAGKLLAEILLDRPP